MNQTLDFVAIDLWTLFIPWRSSKRANYYRRTIEKVTSNLDVKNQCFDSQ